MTRRKMPRVPKIIRKSCITGKAVWIYHQLSQKSEHQAYKRACAIEANIMRQWGNIINRRRKNIKRLLEELTAKIPLLCDIGREKHEAAKVLRQLAENEPSKQSDFYDHIQEEARRRRNARKREKRWHEKYGRK